MSQLYQEFDMKIDILHALEDFLDIYSNHGEMVVTEAISNALDIKATEVNIDVGVDSEGHEFISFHNNGPSMTEEQFENYHVLARSSKTKGSGIGFAGIGAKVYLAAWKDTVIFTETSDGTQSFSSKMFVKDYQLKAIYCQPIQNRKGTFYKVLLVQNDYLFLKENVEKVILTCFNNAMIAGLKITINNDIIKPWIPKTLKTNAGVIKVRKKQLPFKILITDDDVPDDRCNIEYHVAGKKIIVRQPSFLMDVEPKFQKNFHVIVDSFEISDQLNLNKSTFKNGFVTFYVFPAVDKVIHQYLEKIGYLKKDNQPSSAETNPLTKFIEELFKDPKYSWLNPEALVGTSGLGNQLGSKTSNSNSNSGNNQHRNSDPKSNSGDHKKKNGFGIMWVFSESKGEGWIDLNSNRPAINLSHPLYIKYENTITARNYHIAKVLIMILIKNASNKRELTVDEAFDTQSELMTLAKDVMWSKC